jgi:type I restriction enzyme S subunit
LPEGDFKYVTAKNIRPWGLDMTDMSYVDAKTHQEIYARCPVERNDVLYIKDGATTGLAVVNPLDEQFSMLSSVALLKPNRKALDSSYLKYWLNSPETLSMMLDKMTGTAIRRLTLTTISSQQIPLPPLPEQRRIVAKVDGLTARTARARKELNRIPTLIARYKQRLLALAFSGELTAGWRAQNKDAQPIAGRSPREIRSKFSTGENDEFDPPFDIPPNWRWLRLPEIGDLDRGKSRHRPRNDPKLFGGPYPFVQTGDVRAADRVLTEFETTYSEFGLEQSRLWPIGTVCITIAANIAETAILGIEACFPDSVVGFLPDADKISGAFVEFFIRTMRSELEAFAPATAQKNINLNVLSSVRVPVPPAEEQAEIVRRIESAFGWLDRMAADHAAAARLLPKLDAAILAKAFRGELVPQDPNDEPASVLLERVNAERQSEAKKPKPKHTAKSVQIFRPDRAERELEVYPVRFETDAVRAPRKQAMSKSRQDDDVKNKPYLAGLLKSAGRSDVQSLFRAADLSVADFYKQLAWEIGEGHILDNTEELKAA